MYRITIDLGSEEITVIATSAAGARRKALMRLDRKQASSYIRKSWPDNRKIIYIDEIGLL